MIKKMLVVLVGVLLVAAPVMAHCGKCGMDGAAKGEAAHAGATCPMHGDKNATLTEASAALQASNPDLAKKLSDMAAKCCGEHKA